MYQSITKDLLIVSNQKMELCLYIQWIFTCFIAVVNGMYKLVKQSIQNLDAKKSGFQMFLVFKYFSEFGAFGFQIVNEQT